MPSSIKRRAAIVPARPSPPRQWTRTSSRRRRSERNSSPATSHSCSNLSSGIDTSTIGRWNHNIFRRNISSPRRSTLSSTPRLQKRNDRGCSPIADFVEIPSEIAIPLSAHGVRVIFPRAESDSDPSELGPSSYDRDLQGVGQGCSFHSQSPLASSCENAYHISNFAAERTKLSGEQMCCFTGGLSGGFPICPT